MRHLLIVASAAMFTFAVWASPGQAHVSSLGLTSPGVPVVDAGYSRRYRNFTRLTIGIAAKAAAGPRSASCRGSGLSSFGRQACGVSRIARALNIRLVAFRTPPLEID
jgi:hypothetical protein